LAARCAGAQTAKQNLSVWPMLAAGKITNEFGVTRRSVQNRTLSQSLLEISGL